MAETAGSLRTTIGRRIRDPNGTAHAAADVLTVLTHAQRLVNAKTKALLSSTTFTRTARVPLNVIPSPFWRVEACHLGAHELQRIDWRTLSHYDPRWFRSTAETPTVWSRIGSRLLLVWPGTPVAQSDVTLVATGSTATLAADGTATDLPDQHMPAILDIAEQVLLLRQRLFASLKDVSGRQTKGVQRGEAT